MPSFLRSISSWASKSARRLWLRSASRLLIFRWAATLASKLASSEVDPNVRFGIP